MQIRVVPDFNLTEYDVRTEVIRASIAREEINDQAARIIASWWQSPGRVGHVLAGLASGAPVDSEELSDDISRTIRDHYRDASAEDKLALDMLGTWALNYGR